MPTIEDLERFYSELERKPGPTPKLDELDKTLYAREVARLSADVFDGVIMEIRRAEQFRPLPSRISEIAESLMDATDLLPPAQAEAYRPVGEIRHQAALESGAVVGGGNLLRALESKAKPGAGETRESIGPGRRRFLEVVSELRARGDMDKPRRSAVTPPRASTLGASLEAAGLENPNPKKGMPRRTEEEDVRMSLFAILTTEPQDYRSILRILMRSGYRQDAVDAGLRTLREQGNIAMRLEDKVSLWWLAEAAQQETKEGASV